MGARVAVGVRVIVGVRLIVGVRVKVGVRVALGAGVLVVVMCCWAVSSHVSGRSSAGNASSFFQSIFNTNGGLGSRPN